MYACPDVLLKHCNSTPRPPPSGFVIASPSTSSPLQYTVCSADLNNSFPLAGSEIINLL